MMNSKDRKFLIQMQIRDWDHPYSDMWSQIYDYINETYGENSRDYRRELLNEMHRVKWHEYKEIYDF